MPWMQNYNSTRLPLLKKSPITLLRRHFINSYCKSSICLFSISVLQTNFSIHPILRQRAANIWCACLTLPTYLPTHHGNLITSICDRNGAVALFRSRSICSTLIRFYCCAPALTEASKKNWSYKSPLPHFFLYFQAFLGEDISRSI